jgi:hypothetical protein
MEIENEFRASKEHHVNDNYRAGVVVDSLLHFFSSEMDHRCVHRRPLAVV